MDYSPYYVPQSIAPILAESTRTKVPLISQPSGLAGALPGLGQIAQGGFDVAAAKQKKQSVMQAQQDYSNYLSKVDSGTATPQDDAAARMAAMALGIKVDFPDTLGNNLKKSEIEKNNATTQALKTKPGPISEDQKIENIKRETAARYSAGAGGQGALTPQEMNALRMASVRQSNPLPVSMINFRGPRAKIIAQSLMDNPNWSPAGGEASLAAAKTAANATAHIQGGKGYEIGALGGTIEDTLDKLEPLLPTLAPNQFAVLNRAYQAGLKQVNDPTVNKALVYLNEATALQASVLKGGGAPTDEDIKLAKPYFNQGLNSQGFSGVREAIKNVNASRVGRLQGNYKQQGGPQYTQTATGPGGQKMGLNPTTNQWEPMQ